MQMFFNSLFSFIVNFEGLNRFDFSKIYLSYKKGGRDVPTNLINDCLCQFFFALHSIYLSLLALVSFNNLVRGFLAKNNSFNENKFTNMHLFTREKERV